MIYLPRSILERYLLPQDDCRCKLAVNAAARSLVYKASHPGEQNKMNRRDFIAGCVGRSLTVRAGEALAQSGPLTRIVFPFAAGGGGDTLCRILAQHLSQLLDRTVIVENRTGGDGLIGIKSVKSAAPDGATILITTGPTMYLLPMTEIQPSFDTARDFVPVSLLARFELGTVATPPIHARTSNHFVPC